MVGMALLPSPAAVVELSRYAIGQVVETAATVATVPFRLLGLLGQTELLVSRVSVLAERAEGLIDRVERAVAEAESLIARVGGTASEADTLVTRVGATAGEAETLVARVGVTAGEAETLVARVGATAGEAGNLVARVGATAGEAETLVARVGVTAGEAETLVARVGVTAGEAGALVAGAGGTVGDAAEVVQETRKILAAVVLAVDEVARVTGVATDVLTQAKDTSADARELLDGYAPTLRRAAPLAARFVEELTPEEVTAAIKMIDELPRLREHLTNDVMPLLGKLDQVGPDLHALLEVTNDLHLAIAGLPGLRMLRRRGEERVAEENLPNAR
ncbi:hypothetical protein CLV70_11581 [Pseudosporangium ferrugineum]|uniref:Methyl-accepting chemotaxis protein n=2 Tax=Pseudosporangium ferrugineum TaxID=439699 RepID=A0A2T0RQ81_9ACTN|nr:hypothetical protein CLV70_11581 [Pseudosporangium ferrugineum]